MFKVRAKIQHVFNPLHVYCRLTPVLGKRKALAVAHLYESYTKKILHQNGKISFLAGEGSTPDDRGRWPEDRI